LFRTLSRIEKLMSEFRFGAIEDYLPVIERTPGKVGAKVGAA
jgi:hypothetical protein